MPGVYARARPRVVHAARARAARRRYPAAGCDRRPVMVPSYSPVARFARPLWVTVPPGAGEAAGSARDHAGMLVVDDGRVVGGEGLAAVGAEALVAVRRRQRELAARDGAGRGVEALAIVAAVVPELGRMAGAGHVDDDAARLARTEQLASMGAAGAAPDGTGRRPLGGSERIRPHQRHLHVPSGPVSMRGIRCIGTTSPSASSQSVGLKQRRCRNEAKAALTHRLSRERSEP